VSVASGTSKVPPVPDSGGSEVVSCWAVFLKRLIELVGLHTSL
jgi:hypothetical protein